MYTFTSVASSLVPVGTGVLGVESLASAAVHGEYVCVEQCALKRLAFALSVSVVSTGACVVAFKKRTAIGVTANEVTLGTLTIPATATAGKVVVKEINEAVLAPGEVLALEVTTAAAGGGAAGSGYYGYVLEEDPEYVLNQANVIVSA